MSNISNYTERQLEKVLDSFTDAVMQLPNVNGVGISNKEQGGKELDCLCLKVYVEKKVPPDQLKPEELVPALYEFEGKQYPTDVKEIGKIIAY